MEAWRDLYPWTEHLLTAAGVEECRVYDEASVGSVVTEAQRVAAEQTLGVTIRPQDTLVMVARRLRKRGEDR